MDKNQKRKQDRALRRILGKAKGKGMKIPLLPDQKVLKNDKMKVYSAEEAIAAKSKRDKKANQKPVIIDGSFIPPKVKTSKEIAQHDLQADMLLKFSEPLERIQDDMVLQAMRYIIGPALDFPLDKIYRLFKWQKVSRHPVTDVLLKGEKKFQVFYFWGDKGEELLKNKRNHVALIWQKTDFPTFKEDENGKIIGLNNNWKYLFDDDSEYSGDPLE